MQMMQFTDKLVPYEVFLNDVASKVVSMMKDDADDPEFISQRKAFQIFGRANVERWRDRSLVTPHVRPGKLEYRTSELRYLQRRSLDR